MKLTNRLIVKMAVNAIAVFAYAVVTMLAIQKPNNWGIGMIFYIGSVENLYNLIFLISLVAFRESSILKMPCTLIIFDLVMFLLFIATIITVNEEIKGALTYCQDEQVCELYKS